MNCCIYIQCSQPSKATQMTLLPTCFEFDLQGFGLVLLQSLFNHRWGALYQFFRFLEPKIRDAANFFNYFDL